ncbi:MAG: cytochrome-c peroxidase [Myxococcota bacterium]|nr:cytochrome-c peroxidase [Myxococcota bacterium]
MKTLRWTVTLAAMLALGACGDDEERPAAEATEAPAEETEAPAAERPLREVVGTTFEAIPEDATAEIDREKMLLGRRLYHDPALSGDGSVSCATCHMLSHGGAEPRRSSTGIRGQIGPINSPTVLNAVYNFRQFWDGRAADLAEQAAGPVSNPIEMGGDWPTILERLQDDEEYVAAFNAEYGEGGLNQENVIDAIVQYESYLVTPSPFDRWLGGDDDALTEQQQRGLRAFMSTGCHACHSGRNLGGLNYQKLGAVHDYFERRGGALTEADQGRFNVTQNEDDRHKFKVPTLRNVAITSPYFHDGHEPNLAGAVRTMAYVQLGQELTDAQVADIVAFLGALTGEIPADAYMPGAAGSEAATTPGEPDAEDVVEAHPEAPVPAEEDDADRGEAAE